MGKLTRGRRRAPGVYEGPGLWEGCAVVPAVVLVAGVSALVVAVTDIPGDWTSVGSVSLVTGVAAWIGLWELFVRLHPRFSEGSGETVKVLVVLGGPPLFALLAAVGTAVLLAG